MIDLTAAEMIAIHWASCRIRDNRRAAVAAGEGLRGAVDDRLDEACAKLREELKQVHGMEVPEESGT